LYFMPTHMHYCNVKLITIWKCCLFRMILVVAYLFCHFFGGLVVHPLQLSKPFEEWEDKCISFPTGPFHLATASCKEKPIQWITSTEK